jgi:hypothetical protein
MLRLVTQRRYRDCDGATRRDFLRVGGLGLSALGLPQLLAARAQAKAAGQPVKDTAVIWLWLGGGPTHVETFDPKMTAPSEYRSVTGEVATPIAGETVGGTLPKIANVADRMALVRSFAHRNNGHGGGTHWVMTGYDNREADQGGLPSRPSIGSILSRYRGATSPATGMPTYVRLGGVGADGPAFLGKAYAPFDPGGQARRNMELTVEQARLEDRRGLLAKMSQARRVIDREGLAEGLDHFDQQAFELVTGSAAKAFDLDGENPKLVAKYGKGLGENLLKARRLCEAGCGFVTVTYGGWDNHGNIERAMKSRSEQLDAGVAALVEDIHDRGLADKILLVITGEFGRTPRVNRNAGRDHWAALSTLALAGGGLKMGQVVGQSASKVDVPATTPIGPQDLMATVFHVLGLPRDLQFVDTAGRPVYMIDKGTPIAELV